MTSTLAASASKGPALKCPVTVCSHSIGRRLSYRLALFTMAVLTALFSFSWFGVGMLIQERNTQDLNKRCELLSDVLMLEARAGGETAVLQWLKSDAPMRAQSQIKVWRADNSLLWADEAPQLSKSTHLRTHRFTIEAPGPIQSPPRRASMAWASACFSRDALSASAPNRLPICFSWS